jgi:hypothetical protein
MRKHIGGINAEYEMSNAIAGQADDGSKRAMKALRKRCGINSPSGMRK